MKPRTPFDVVLLKEWYIYDPKTGLFYHKETGDQLHSFKANGYLKANFFVDQLLCHRVAWLYMTGEWPSNYLDHINGIRDDNRWENLRLSDSLKNGRNQKMRPGPTGILGVSRNKKSGHYRAQIYSITVYSGTDFFEACCRRKSEEVKRGYWQNHRKK